jgi:hypothetical protein
MSIRSKNKIKSSRNITSMVMFQCFLNIFGMGPYLISNILSNVLVSTQAFQLYTNISIGILLFSHGLTLFVYLNFNKIFREIFIGYFNF